MLAHQRVTHGHSYQRCHRFYSGHITSTVTQAILMYDYPVYMTILPLQSCNTSPFFRRNVLVSPCRTSMAHVKQFSRPRTDCNQESGTEQSFNERMPFRSTLLASLQLKVQAHRTNGIALIYLPHLPKGTPSCTPAPKTQGSDKGDQSFEHGEAQHPSHRVVAEQPLITAYQGGATITHGRADPLHRADFMQQ